VKALAEAGEWREKVRARSSSMATRGKKKREGGSGAQLRRAMEERGAGERWLGLEARLRGPRASGAHQRCAAGDVGWGVRFRKKVGRLGRA
jgi:hypothetical protein